MMQKQLQVNVDKNVVLYTFNRLLNVDNQDILVDLDSSGFFKDITKLFKLNRPTKELTINSESRNGLTTEMNKNHILGIGMSVMKMFIEGGDVKDENALKYLEAGIEENMQWMWGWVFKGKNPMYDFVLKSSKTKLQDKTETDEKFISEDIWNELMSQEQNNIRSFRSEEEDENDIFISYLFMIKGEMGVVNDTIFGVTVPYLEFK